MLAHTEGGTAHPVTFIWQETVYCFTGSSWFELHLEWCYPTLILGIPSHVSRKTPLFSTFSMILYAWFHLSTCVPVVCLLMLWPITTSLNIAIQYSAVVTGSLLVSIWVLLPKKKKAIISSHITVDSCKNW